MSKLFFKIGYCTLSIFANLLFHWKILVHTPTKSLSSLESVLHTCNWTSIFWYRKMTMIHQSRNYEIQHLRRKCKSKICFMMCIKGKSFNIFYRLLFTVSSANVKLIYRKEHSWTKGSVSWPFIRLTTRLYF